ncbi:filamentous haemagglutinin family protein [Methylosinus sp. Sm6]|uniref:filamentous haemagglutinin family protein n=1 Tax=Methylosinus sp. Sm6 TaxID=2866948 RepID=UPI001C99FC2F|nr:filamentous haemagglutinin family protein [Methylosinus sp. Sm6]MBY6242346.1 filamentous hemagglutinin family protein [Methylosinus sp. Sm6]
MAGTRSVLFQPFSGRRRGPIRRTLLATASATVLALASPQDAKARPLGGFGATTSAPTTATTDALAGAAQATAIAKQTQTSLTRAAQAIQSLQAAQAAARSAAQAATSLVPNGLKPGGLVVDPRVGFANGVSTTPGLWSNISAPVETVDAGGHDTVTLTQSAKRAIATWQQFNVGRDTTVHFDQSGGNSENGNNWVVLNRVDASGSPSRILGQIKAEGTVLLLNPNGVIFTGTSQINVHSLVAASMDMNSFVGTAKGAFKASGPAYAPILADGIALTAADGTPLLAPSDEANANATFLNNGLFVNTGFRLPNSFASTGDSAVFSAGLVPGQDNVGVRVEAGARISTDVGGFDNGGYVALLGPQVTNAGSITTSAGQIILAAAGTVQLAEPSGTTSQTGFATRTDGSVSNQLLYSPPSVSGGASGVNDASGLLVARRGNVTMIGDTVEQRGLVEATTSVTRAGSITMVAGDLRFAPGSLTTILPEENGETIPSDATSLAAFVAPRIDIAATDVTFQSSSWILAPSATMVVTGPGRPNGPGGEAPLPSGRVVLEAGSVIDLSGLTSTRSYSDYLYTFKVTPNDVADTPLAQNLIGQTVTIDLTLSGTRADGETWVGSPLFASSGAGYLANVPQGIDQLLSKGGSLSFGGGSSSVGNNLGTVAFVDVLQAPGSVIDVSGGLIQYAGAHMSTTQLVGADGRFYDIGAADPFIGNTIYRGFAVVHSRWGVIDYYASSLLRGGYVKPDDFDGMSAGGVSVAAVTPILEGAIAGDIAIGARQRALARIGANGVQATPDQLPTGASLAITMAADSGGGRNTAILLVASAPDLLGTDAALGVSPTLPTNADGAPVITYSTDRFSSLGLGSISIAGATTLAMAEGASLSVRDGGSIKLANVAAIDGSLIAHGGSIVINGVTPASLAAASGELPSTVVGGHAVLDVSGRWINDAGRYSDAAGALYINGGSVSLATYNMSEAVSFDENAQWTVTAEDHSASIVLQAGSIVDVSSGGYVAADGRLKTGSDGLPVGKGGNVSLRTYAGTWQGNTFVFDYFGGNLGHAPQSQTAGNVVMDGTIYAGGLSQGGTFTLRAPMITIDGQATKVASITEGEQAGTVVLPTSFFSDSGFGSFDLTSVYGSATVAAGTTLTLKQQNYLLSSTSSLPATGARPRDFAAFGYAPDGLRHAANLALTQAGYRNGAADSPSETARLLIDEGASILADPLANITLTAGGPAVILGTVRTHGGKIAINEGMPSGFPAYRRDGLPQYVWLGQNSVLDVSGTFVPDPRVTAYSTGTVLAGGSIVFSGISSSSGALTEGAGTVIALAGSIMDISGASATIEEPGGASLFGPRITTREIWSDGGTLTTGGYLGGTIRAAGGAPQAAGGKLVAGDMIVTQSGDVSAAFGSTPPTWRSDAALHLPPGANVTADTLNSAGFGSVSFPGPTFSGDVDLEISGSILIDSFAAITLLPAGVYDKNHSPSCEPFGACIPSIGATKVTLEANYIRLANSGLSSFASQLPQLADGELTLAARQQIDVVGVVGVKNAGVVNLVSGGDIRLIGTYDYGKTLQDQNGVDAASDGYGGFPFVGALLVADNLNLTARTIYPATNTAFLIESLGLAPAAAAGVHNRIAFSSNGQAPVAPLSAGGAIVVDAKTIQQGGALYAPLGSIVLGLGAGQTLPSLFVSNPTNNPYDPVQNNTGLLSGLAQNVMTDRVTLLPGSVTSVSAAGLMIPYGSTTDGAEWTSNDAILNGPPAKLITLGGANVDAQAGAILDGRGGGDIYATEFIPGTGGSRNVLTTSTQAVYALLPGFGSALAPYDPAFATSVAAGLTVTLSGGNGVPAGTYTLLPAEYATLPGAYRVVVVSTKTNPYSQSFATADGSVYATGVLGNAITGSQSPQAALLQIQSKEVWTRYSQIDVTTGKSYFTALAASNATALPRLAQDAARLSVAAGVNLSLDATNLFDPASGGLGGMLDITGEKILVAASDRLASFGAQANGTFTPSAEYEGYLVLDADMLSDFGIESTLIGGYRSSTSEGTLVTATALDLEVATDAAHPLTGPELLLVSLASTVAGDGHRGLVVDDGSVIAAKGAVAGGAATKLLIGVDPVAQFSGLQVLLGYTAGVSGDGALLRVSNGGVADIQRRFVPGVYRIPATTPAPEGPVSPVALGALTIGENVALSGAALTLDASGSTTLAASARLVAKNYDLASGLINLGGGSGGLVVTTGLIGQFAGAESVRLRSASVFNLYGSNAFGDAANRIGALTLDGAGLYSDGGATTIIAGDIAFVDSQAVANKSGADTGGAGGVLALDASGALTFSAGSKSLSGFASVSATAGSKALFSGAGGLDAGGAKVTLTAPLILVDKGASQSLSTTGALTLARGAGAAPSIDPTFIGGSLSFAAASINASGTLVAQGGKLTLEATTGDLVLSGDALLSAAGTRIMIGDLVQDTPAGAIRLVADAGDVKLGAGTTVDVSGAGRGYAGSLSIYARGAAKLAGALKGGAKYDDLGGELLILAGRLDGALPLASGFTRGFTMSLGQGDIVIDAGETLKSENVLLVANGGGVVVDGHIDASSASGGSIALYGAGRSTAAAGTANASGVAIGSRATLEARYRAPDADSPGYGNGESTKVQRGGTITLGTTGAPDGSLNADYGYQNVPRSGAITVAAGATFDVSGGDGGADIDNTGGSVVVRAPILADGTINVRFSGAIVTSARADGAASGDPLVVNAFAVWSTTDASTDPNKHFDGVIDPAGFYGADGTQLIVANAKGVYPSSTAAAPADGAYLPHVQFYQKTLLDFVNAPFDTSAIAARLSGATLKVGSNAATALPSSALHLRPEIDLVNPSTNVNSGNIVVASNWNFGAGSIDANGNVNLLYRTTSGGEPGTLMLRAANNVKINATISDGFFTRYTLASGGAEDAASIYARESSSSLYLAYLAMFSNGVLQYDSSGLTNFLNNYQGLSWDDIGVTPPPTTSAASASFFNLSQSVFDTLQFELQAPTVISGSASVIDQYNQYYAAYAKLFRLYETEIVAMNTNGAQGLGVAGGTYLSYADVFTMAQIFGIGLDPSSSSYLYIPAAPTLSSSYYNILGGFGSVTYLDGVEGGWASTTATDYATQWAAYFYNVANFNLANHYYGFGIFNTTWDNVAGVAARTGVPYAVAVTPPYAPPAYATMQPGYFSSAPAAHPADAIANNASAYYGATGLQSIVNTTASADLMTAAVSGKGSFSYNFVGGALFDANGMSSVDPNAVARLSSLSDDLTGNVTVDGHVSYTNPVDGLTVNVPTLVRTGTNAITIAAAGDFALLDVVSPGAVYTAGHVADNADGFDAPTLRSVTTSSGLVTTPVWATAGGDIVITAGRDIIGIETPTDPTGTQFTTEIHSGTGANYSIGVSTGQFWSAWHYVDGLSNGSSTAPFDPSAGAVQYSSWINYGTFFQGFGALGGGDITLKAGRNVQDVSASLPETIQLSGGRSAGGAAALAHFYGGGNLLVEAGGDLLSSVFYVGRGTGLIRAGGSIVADATLYTTEYRDGHPVAQYYDWDGVKKTAITSVPLLLAVQDSYISVQARGDIELGGIFAPTNIPADYKNDGSLPLTIGAAFQSYGANSGVSLTSGIGKASLGAGGRDTLFTHFPYQGIGTGGQSSGAVPASLSIAALTGDIDLLGVSLHPSATGELSLVAGGSIKGLGAISNSVITMSDGATGSILGSPSAALTAPLHADDDTPVLIYAGEDIDSVNFTLNKPARMWAGRDIANVVFIGQNNADGDITSIIAGRDILAARTPDIFLHPHRVTTSSFTLYGPGDFLLEAGRNLGPFNTYGGVGGGILAVGDGANYAAVGVAVKSYLPTQGADITLRYGVGGGVDYAAALAIYGDAAIASASGMDFVSAVIPQLEQYLERLIVAQAKAAGVADPVASVKLTPAEAADIFTALPTLAIGAKLAALAEKAGYSGLSFDPTPSQALALQSEQQALKLAMDRGFLDLLTRVSLDYNNPASAYYGKYARAYDAISTLFPAALGYTDNSEGGTGVAPAMVHTGDLRMARSLVETQTGGGVDILGPGGNAYVGSNRADTLTPAQQGVLTLQGGSIRSYTDGGVLVYQSRIFTEQGGNIELFSANGDLNAGKGPKSAAAYPPLRVVCDADGYCRVNPAGLVTGAGIGALISVPGQDPTKSDVVLTAPHGTVDAGAAGIRVAGNLNIVAQRVLNAYNVQVQGTAVGLQASVSGPNVGALTAASNTSAAATKVDRPSAGSDANDKPSIILVEVIGYGGGEVGPSDDPSGEERRGRRRDQRSYDTNGAVQILGHGDLTDRERQYLNKDEKERL